MDYRLSGDSEEMQAVTEAQSIPRFCRVKLLSEGLGKPAGKKILLSHESPGSSLKNKDTP